MSLINPKCDGDRCVQNGPVRKLKHGDSNLILCRTCYAYERSFRIERNKELSFGARFPLPKWSELEPYTTS